MEDLEQTLTQALDHALKENHGMMYVAGYLMQDYPELSKKMQAAILQDRQRFA